MVAYIIGGALIALGIGLIIARSSQSNKLMQMKGTETSPAKELHELQTEVAKEMGAGSFNQIAELKGKCTCASPLVSELAKVSCVYYSMRVTREYEETYWDTDSNGHRIQKRRRGSDSVAQNTRFAPFYIEDATGKMRVNPDGATFVTEKAFSHFEPGEVHGPSLSFGGLTIALGNALMGGASTRTLGYRYEEDVIPLDKNLYVLGEASDSQGELAIQKPSDKKNKFLISVKSEEELIRSSTNTMTGLLVGSLISGAAGITVIILTLLNVFDF